MKILLVEDDERLSRSLGRLLEQDRHKAGMAIVVEGKQRTDGSIDATAIGAGKGRGRDGHKDAKPDAPAAPTGPAATSTRRSIRGSSQDLLSAARFHQT